MNHFDDAELPELPQESSRVDLTRLDFPSDTQERTRLGSQGELMTELDAFIKTLRSQHRIDRIDRDLEFIAPSLVLPEDLSLGGVDSVSVRLGEARLDTSSESKDITAKEFKPAEEIDPTIYITVRVHAGNQVLVLHRASDPHLEEMEDYVETTVSESEDDATIHQNFLEKNISQAEFNAILIGLIAESPTSIEQFADISFLEASSFSALSNELEARAASKRMSGAYTFNDGNSELEFSEQELIEFFELTHTIKDGINPKTIAVSGSTSSNLIMNFVEIQGGKVRSTAPEVSDLLILKDVAKVESASRLRKYRTERLATTFGTLALDDVELESVDTLHTDAIDTAADREMEMRRATDRLILEDILGAGIDEDRFNSPDSSAA
jgi:hypothetical protein